MEHFNEMICYLETLETIFPSFIGDFMKKELINLLFKPTLEPTSSAANRGSRNVLNDADGVSSIQIYVQT